MIGKTLQTWFKEFATLVFTQSIQAFIYAIIIVIITFGMKPSNTGGMEESTQNAALGFISVIALTSVFKVEEMLRKILGLGTSQASVKGAMGSIAKTAIAFKLGQRVMNNATKLGSGVAQKYKARVDAIKANKKYDEETGELRKSEARANTNYDNAEHTADAKYNAKISEIDSSKKSSVERAALKEQAAADRDTAKQKALQNKEDRQESIKKQYKSLDEQNKTKLEEIKKTNREGTKKIYSAGLETVGAGLGGTMGAIIGGADGNLGEAAQGLMAGAGIGDAVGEATTNTAFAGIGALESTHKGIGKYIEDINKEMDAQMGERKNVIKAAWKHGRNGYHKNTEELKRKIDGTYRDSNVDDV